MKIAVQFLIILSLCLSLGCAREKKTTREAAAVEADTPGPIETFTGVVVNVAEGYRFRSFDEPENLQRLTRAKGGQYLASEEIELRKYYGKTLTVKGDFRKGWILRAQVTGQWLEPGQSAGPTLTGPEPIPAKPKF